MKKVVHIINGLGSGGAENMLYKLIKYSDKKKYAHQVISLLDEGVIGEKIEAEGVQIHCLNMSKKNMLLSLIRARKICKQADLVNTWLYYADMFGFLVGKILLSKKLIWNVRHSNLNKDTNKSTTLRLVKINSVISKLIDKVTYNSSKAVSTHAEFGFSNKNTVVIPNGFELNKFVFSLKDRIRIRKEFELREDQKAIVTVGRWDIQKDYYTLIKALFGLKKRNDSFKMLMCGTGLNSSNKELTDLIDTYQLSQNINLLGRREDVPALLSASDIYVSSSLGESFSNAIGEAMACELFCVVTDVGDSKIIVGDTGVVVKAQDYNALCNALLNSINCTDLKERGKNAREKVHKTYDIEKIVKSYEKIWDAD